MTNTSDHARLPDSGSDKTFHKKLPWKQYGNILQESLEYVEKRARGDLKSLKSPWASFNAIGLNGLEWQSLIVIAARPGVGKTLIANSLTRNLHKLNPDQSFHILHFQFEMLGRNMGIRELSASNNLDIRYIQSAKDDGMPVLTKGDYLKMKSYVDDQMKRKEHVVDQAMTVSQMRETLIEFYKMFREPFVVTLDHTLLVKRSASETSSQQTLQNLATMLTEMKNKLPVTFIILTQLNREIDDAERQKPGKLSNYPTEADVFGSDYLLQCADVMVAYNRPAKYNLRQYGPLKYMIEPTDKFLLAMHVLKNRFGNVSIEWYRADYATMSIVETAAPRHAAAFSAP